MADGHCQFDMPNALPSHARQCHLDTATITDHTAVLDALVLAAIAFPVPHRAENAFAEQAALFRLEGAVIDRLGVFHFPVRPRADHIRRRHPNADLVECVRLFQTERGARGRRRGGGGGD
jgi:hypothetical protein